MWRALATQRWAAVPRSSCRNAASAAAPRPGRRAQARASAAAAAERGDGDKPSMEGDRLGARLSRTGLCSRREAARWIEGGRVSVDSEVVFAPGLRVTASSRIVVDGRPVVHAPPVTQVFLYHKTRGVLCSTVDDRGDATYKGAPAAPRRLLQQELVALGLPPRLLSVGRLDFNTTGLMLLTNNGALSRQLELSDLVRVYAVKARGTIYWQRLRAVNERDSITVEGVCYTGVKVSVAAESLSDEEEQRVASVSLTVRIREGKNREVRKVMRFIGLEVSRLHRTQFGPFSLSDDRVEGGPSLKAGDALKIDSRSKRLKLAVADSQKFA